MQIATAKDLPEVVQMKNTKSALEKKKIALLFVAVVLVAAVAFTFGFQLWNHGKKEKEKINRGVAYLESLEKQDISAISSKIDAVKAAHSLEMSETDENAVWGGFDSAMILGDSRAVGFRYFEFLLENQVIAESGRKITDVPDEIETLKKASPKQIFLCFGINDIRSELWPEPAEYAAAYQEVVALLHKELPGTTIYINSILPAVGDGYSSYEGYARISDYNAAIKEMAEKNRYRYVDNDSVAAAHVDLYEADGLHLQKEFYKYWAANMLTEVKKQ